MFVKVIKNTKMGLFIWILCLLTWLISLSFLPNEIAMQYNNDGSVSWSINKFLGSLIFMTIVTFIYVYYLILPIIDPKKKNYKTFKPTYSLIVTTILIIVYFAEILIIISNIGIMVNPTIVINLVLAFLFIIVGNYLQKIRINWFIGFRTPWTISSEKNWKKTHRFTGRIYIVLGVIFVLLAFLNFAINWMTIIMIILLASLIPFIYSFVIYKKES
ncbi:SdpI family protein [Staphylococcus haemolyticus]|uniref:SdpI family protein n=1 Tax=Staphylococcus haemolyticus TaxID=1283 RepID=UPI001C1E9E23|nr:SdpI family protein [Staphylococcus haemolyticus]MBU6949653.1 SdpI family protein [Staphylococcus haemolyticus]MBU7213451.1 SdpI family protein [Staphylococcus haemolyticus]